MGLDMYAYRVAIDAGQALPDADAVLDTLNAMHGVDGWPFFRLIDRDFHYWRKHPDLHGWMERLYSQKGGRAESFNCCTVRLESADLDALEQAVKDRTLPKTSGFFFGESSPECRDDDLVFIAKARDAIAAGDAVYYDSWW